ncbi:hypothetical protein pipiens_000006, partial [Culex pipiens pipiens]
MSWFDTTGIANLAKTALKEAQKQIDKALDIKDDEEDGSGSVVATGASAPEEGEQQKGGGESKTEPSTPVQGGGAKGGGNVGKGQADSIWGSFTGSFFEQPVTAANVTVTKAPSSLKRKSFEDSGIAEVPAKGGSPENSSESIELLSPVTTPGSALTSPSSAPTLGQESDSVEVIRPLGTPSSVSSPESITSTTTERSPAEGEEEMRFTSVELGDDDISVEEDSVSYTLSEQPITVMETGESTTIPITVAPSRSSLHLTLDKTSRQMTFSEVSVCDTEESNDSETTVTSKPEESLIEKSYENVEIQTQISDSTHSFEEIPPQHPSDEPTPSHLLSKPEPTSSGDEIETATSSDIEIISSPGNGGDSSSTNSCGAAYVKIPDGKSSSNIDSMMGKKRGHTRELSEISVQSANSDDLSESEKLTRRLAEVSELLEQREFRLLELGRQNAELHEQNLTLTEQLASKQKRAESCESEEYTQRLSALERKFQQAIREREAFKRQLETCRSEAQGKLNRGEVDKLLAEKDFLVEELKKEGESLSKQVLNHSNIIKKLRAKEKESEGTVRKLREEIGDLTDETERLNRSLSAKEEVERSQIDAVHKLSSEKRKLEKECGALRGQLDDQGQKLETLKKSFDFAKRELTEKTEAFQEMARKSSLLATMETEHSGILRANEQISTELEDLREKLRRSEAEHAQRMQRLKNENAELLQRVEETETRAEEEKNATAMVTVPLMKQIESLQNATRNKERLWEQREAELARKLDEAVEKGRNFGDNERTLKEQIFTMNGRISNLEERLTAALFRSEELTNNLQQKQIELDLFESDHKLKLKSLEDERKSLKGKLADLEYHPPIPTLPNSRTSSPTPSMGNLSLPESIGSIPWNREPEDDVGSNSGGRQTIGPGLLHTTSLLENLQATLKQRDGEVYQLQWELSRFQQERNVLNTEISSLTAELDGIREKFEQTVKLEEDFGALQTRYDALLQLYGEAVEKIEELKLDLVDVKEMYKVQIDDLLRQVNALNAAASKP